MDLSLLRVTEISWKTQMCRSTGIWAGLESVVGGTVVVMLEWDEMQPDFQLLTLFPLTNNDHNSCLNSIFQFVKHLFYIYVYLSVYTHTHILLVQRFNDFRKHHPYFMGKLIGLERVILGHGHIPTKGLRLVLFCFHYTTFLKNLFLLF